MSLDTHELTGKLKQVLSNIFSKYTQYVLACFYHIYLTLAAKPDEVLYVVAEGNKYECVKSADGKDVAYVVLCTYTNRNREAVKLRRELKKHAPSELFSKNALYELEGITYVLDYDLDNGVLRKQNIPDFRYELSAADLLLYANYNVYKDNPLYTDCRYNNNLLNIYQLIRDNPIELVAYEPRCSISQEGSFTRKEQSVSDRLHNIGEIKRLDLLTARKMMAARHCSYYAERNKPI